MRWLLLLALSGCGDVSRVRCAGDAGITCDFNCVAVCWQDSPDKHFVGAAQWEAKCNPDCRGPIPR